VNIKDDIIRSSGSVYEMLIITLDHKIKTDELANLKSILEHIANIPDKIKQNMETRCRKISKFYGFDSGCHIDTRTLKAQRSIEYYLDDYFDLNKHCLDTVACFKSIMLGKGDVCVLSRSPHPFWSFRIRRMIHEIRGVKEVLSTPCYRTRWLDERKLLKSDGEEQQIQIDDTRPFRKPLIFFSFIRINSGSITRPTEWENISKTIQNINNTLRQGRNDSLTEIYLTFSDSQLLIKGEFHTFAQAESWSEKIRKITEKSEMSTQVAYSAENIEWINNNGYRWFRYRDLRHNDSNLPSKDLMENKYMKCGLLIKAEANHAHGIGFKIRDYFNEKWALDFSNNAKPDQLFGVESGVLRPKGYWDILLLVKTKSMFELLRVVVAKLSNHPHVQETRILPLNELTSARNQKTWNNRELNPGRESHKSEKLEFPSVMPYAFFDTCNCDKSQWTDLISFRIYNLRFNFELLLSRVDQLHYSWKNRFPATTPSTFDKIRLRLFTLIDQCCEFISNTSPGDELKRIHLIENLETHYRQQNEFYETLVAVFHEYCEGSHATTMVDPLTNIGERSGMSQLIIEAVNRLMRDYCSVFKESVELDSFLTSHFRKKTSVLFGDNTDIIKDANAVMKSYVSALRPSRRWSGLVSIHTGDDYQMHFESHLLKVPTSVKISAADSLIFTGHEAAHFLHTASAHYAYVLRDYDKDHSTLNHETPSRIGHLLNTYQDELMSMLLAKYEMVLEIHDRNDSNNFEKRQKVIIEVFDKKYNMQDSLKAHFRKWQDCLKKMVIEISIDILSNLLCSPLFALAVAKKTFAPDVCPPVSTERMGISNHERNRWSKSNVLNLPASIRIEIALYVAECLRLDEKWKKPLIKIKKNLDHLNREMKSLWNKTKTRRESPFGFLRLNDFMCVRDVLDAFFNISNERVETLEQAVDHTLSPSPLFFKDPGKTSKNCKDPRDSSTLYGECMTIAERLAHDCEVVTDYPPKYVAAAAHIENPDDGPVIRRPFFPAGRICHSIIYSRKNEN
jgi:hypothetical protein